MGMKRVILRGGSRDGEEISVHAWQPFIYVTRKTTLADSEGLRIDDVHAWKAPEDVYVKNQDGEFEYDRTVHYKP